MGTKLMRLINRLFLRRIFISCVASTNAGIRALNINVKLI